LHWHGAGAKQQSFDEGILVMTVKYKADLPKPNDEVLVDICPWNDETWMAFGRVL
jgi:hypothetical protein